ncbi:MAG: AAA family ATPase, partial [Candidatus Omnitrophica bacterium]|nr:AAA family ATPase [Candidatus Omnitrophota bacterium]
MKKNLENNNDNNLEFNDQFAQAYDTLENSWHNVLIVGKAGTGKSTILQYFRSNTLKNVVVLAPTGVAAVNIKGQTIHSFFRFKPDITPETVVNIRIRKQATDIYKKIDTIIIDEVSMVRADLLDCIDEFMRLHGKESREPFGGVQMIFIGDMYQLPPVVPGIERSIFRDLYKSPYFFDSKVFRKLFNNSSYKDSDENFEFSYDRLRIFELDKIYRQKEERFIELLGAIRNRSITDKQLVALNERYLPDFKPKGDDFYIYLTTTNSLADKVNEAQLNRIDFQAYFSEGEISGKFEQKNLPTQFSLQMKVNAQVMLLNNDPSGRWINGSIGKIVSFVEYDQIVVVELSSGKMVEV